MLIFENYKGLLGMDILGGLYCFHVVSWPMVKSCHMGKPEKLLLLAKRVNKNTILQPSVVSAVNASLQT